MRFFINSSVLVIALFVVSTFTTQAQITVNQATSQNEVENLVEDVLLGSCVTATNVSYTGPASASGTFNATGTSFTMQNGILLTTGGANIAIGPNNLPDARIDQDRGGDADLSSLAGETTFDAVVLEFDFVPQDDTLTFRYVFASEEYPEWVGSEYNDVFGFFVSGPGISGPYNSPAGFPNGSANIALIPGTTTPVAINNVNNGDDNNGPCENCSFYVENTNNDIQYDGYTTVLTAQVVVDPCETYHIRLAVGDAGDQIYDSGVFLEAGSFTSGGGITVDFSDVAVEEGCTDEYIVFRRVDVANNSTAIGATYSVSGTAQMGVDYDVFPTSVSIPAGQDSVIVPISVFLDYTVEGTETIIVNMDQPPCDCLAPGSATINVIDNDVPLALTTTGETTICLGQSANLTASVSGSLPPYSGSWDNGAPAGGNVSVSPTTTTTYTYTVTDACGSQTVDSTETVTVIRPDFNTNDQSQCLDGNSFSFTNTGASGSSVSHFWEFGDGNSSTDENPTHTYLADGDYTVNHYVIFLATNCTASASALMTVYPEPTVSVSVDADVICSGGTDGALSASVSGGTAGYGYSWSPGGATTPSISNLGIGTYTVIINDANGCTDSASGTVTQNDPTPPTITCPATANITTDAGLCSSSASIGVPTTDDNCGVATTVVDNAGPYSVGTTTVTWTVTDDNGNTATCSQDVVVTDDEDPTITCPATANITTDAGLCSSSASIGVPTTDDNCGVATTVVDNAGPYSVGTTTVTWTVTDDNGNTATCSQDVVVTDDEDPTITCPATANITTDAGLCSSSASIGVPTTGDNCGVATTEVDNPGPYSVGTTTVTWTVTDANGNTSTCEQDVVVTDDEDPTIFGCPSDIDVTPASSDCSPEVTWNIPQADDNCSATLSSTHNSGDSFPVGTTTVTYTATDASGNTFSCSFDVTITPSDLVLSIDPSIITCGANISCNGATDGTATANVSGGCLPYSYAWSNGQTTQTATGLGAGTYTVIVTDANGSTESTSITLSEPETLEISTYEVSEYVGGSGVSCNGATDGEIDIQIEGGATCEAYSISWIGPNGFTSTTEDLSGLEAGSYTVTITDANGCITSGTYTISEPATLEPTCTSEDALCNGDANGSVEVSVIGGTAPYSYSWSNGSSDASQSGLTAGTYGVTITDANGCTISCSSTVGEPDVLTAVVTAFDETLVNGCNGSAIAAPTGGTEPYTYEWSDGQGNATAADLCAGTYSVTVTDANGCTYTTSVVINPPTCDLDVDMSSTDVSCNGGSDGTVTATPITQQNNTPFTYVWNNGGSTQTLSGVTAGPYTVVVTDSIGCEASGSVTVSEPTLLTVSTTVVDEQTFGGCDGSATATAGGGTPPYSYEWSDGQLTATASDLCPGTYTVMVTDANGCMETITITVNELLCTGFSVAVNTDGLSCFEAGDGSATAVVTGGTDPFTYSWDNGGTSSSISGLDAGTYTVTVVDAVNCSQTVSGNVTQPALLEAATAVDNVSCNGLGNGVVELTVTGGTPDYDFAWDNGATTEDLYNVGPGSYNVLVTDENGCTTTAFAEVTELDTLGASSIDVQVSCNEGNNGSIDLEPTGGLAPYLYDWSNGATTQDISGLSAGTYSVTFADQNGCLFTYETTISEPDLLVPTCTSEDALCNGDANGSVSVSVDGGTAPYSYSWSNGSTDASQTGLTAGTYVVSVTDVNGCTTTCNSVVGEPDVLTAVVTVQDETLVNGCNGSATANPTGGTPPYSYEWSNGETTQTITDLCAGTYTVIVTDANECEFITSNIVNPPSCDLDVDMSSTDVDCNGGETGTATATPITVQNNTPFTYLWNNGATTQTLSGVTAGPYSVVVTDSIGCEASGSVVISEPTALSVTTVVVDEQNFGACDGSATATADGGTPPYSYEWSDGQTTATASDLCPGTYTVTITDANGCEETVTITVNPLLCTGFSVAINTESLSCFEAGDGSATAVVTGGTAPFTYSWSNGEATSTITGLDAGEYILTVTDAVNCTQTVSANVTQPALLEAVTAVDNVSCHGVGNGVVELTVTGGTAPYDFDWDNGATTEDLNNVGPGSYNVLVTDENGCTVSASAMVTEPDTMQVSSVDVNPTCFEGNDGSIDLTITGGLGPYLVAWDSGQNTADISALTAGNYVATIVDQNGCIYTYSTTLTDPALVVPTITADGPTIFCEGDSVTLTASNAASYSWSPNGEITQSITVYDAGDYTVSVVTEDGCEGTSASTTVSIFQVDPATITADGPTEFCDGSSVVLTASQGSSYLWMPNGETTQSITVTEAGNYSVTVTDANGCESSSADIEITVFDLPEPIVTADGPLSFCDGSSVTLTSSEAAAYSWAPFGQTTQSITVTESGIYRVTITNEEGCQSTSDPIQVIVNDNPEPIITADDPTEFCEGGEVDLLGPNGFATYLWSPNGENTQSITASESGDYQLTVTDEFGCVGESNIITVTEFDVDTATITAQGATEFCDGGEVILIATSGVSYEWSPNGEVTQSINVTESGFYSVTVVDQNGCETTSDAIEVIVNPLPDAIITANGPLEFCEGDSVILAAPAGQAGYSWTPNGETGSTITVSTSGTFSVIVTDENQCSNESDPVSTTMFEQEDVEINADGATEFCDGDQVTLTASTGDSFVWSPNGETTPSITVTESGIYTVSITDANGCSYASEDSVEVTVNPLPVPTVTPDGPTEFCDGESVTLTSSLADSYAWAPNGEATQSIVVTASGTYRVTVTDGNGCQGTSDPVIITVFDLPEPVITADGPLTICPEDSVTLTSTTADAYLWSPNGEVTQSITVSEPGNYSVSVVDANGCEGESETVTVEEFEVEEATVTASGITEFCEGDDVVLTASGGDAYLWSPNGEVTQSITVSETGTYSVTVTDENGCASASDSIDVTVFELPDPTITVSGPTEFCEGDSVTLTVTAGEAYLWEPNGETTQSITVYEAGSYFVEVADENTCVGVSDTVDVEIFIPQEVEVSSNGPVAFCDGDNVELAAIGGVSWTWAPNGETTQSITVSETGEYVVEIIDVNGCSDASDTVIVEVFELPEVSISLSELEICEGDSSLLTAITNDEVIFEWFDNGTTIGGATDSTLFVLDESTYSVLVTDTNGCTATTTAPAIAVGPVPAAVITGGSTACPGETIVLVASGGESYLWSNGETSESISVLADSVGTYTVTVSNEFCSQTSSDSAEVDVFDTPDALIQTNPSGFLEVEHLFDEISGDSSIVFWTWDFGDGLFEEGQAVNNYYSDEGFFTVVVTTENEDGCLGTDTAIVEITQVIDIPNVFTPNGDGYNDHVFIGNFGVDNYELTVYNRWGIVMHHDDTGEVFWDGKTPAGIDAESGTYFYVLDVLNPDHSEGSFKQTGTITLIR